jgi:hypothetical protein
MQAFNGQSDLGTVYLHSGSSGTIITGFFGGYVYVGAANDVIIRRNRNTYVYLGSTQGVATTNNLQILENYRVWVQAYTNPGYNFTNLNISNNFMWGISLQNGNTYSGNIAGNIWAYSAVETEAESNSYPSGNELAGGSFLLQNNILASFTTSTPASNYNYFPWSGVGNCIFNYNVMIAGYNAATFPATGTGNVSIPSDQAASLFEGFPTSGSRSADDRWVLKSGSPALVAARPGSTVNAGIFGGPNPYKLSTIPAIPTIYSLSSPDGNNPAGGTIQINVSTRGNN